MNEQSKEFGLFIDGLRIDRKLSREDLCDEIISISQYKRYLNGSASIPNNKLIELADRLNFSISEIHSLFQKKHNIQYNQIIEVFTQIKHNNFQVAYDKALIIQKDPMISATNEMFLNYCLIKCQYNLELASKIQALSKFSDLIGYPECVTNLSFNRTELAILIEIVYIASSMDNYEPADLIYKVLSSENFQYISSDDRSFVPALYYSLAVVLNKQNKPNEAIKITDNAISYCITYETSNALSHLFLANSFAYFDLGNCDKAIESAQKALMHLYIQGNHEMYESFTKAIESRFKVSLEDIKKTDW